MQAYTGFAQVYDIFMDNVPYDDWTDYLSSLLREYGVMEGLVLELGCGTGNITRRLAAKGYDMIGIDNSEEMLEISRDKEYEDDFEDDYDSEKEKTENNNFETEDNADGYLEDEQLVNSNILYLQQDMRNFELYGTVAAVVSICDSMNYITSEQDLVEVFKLVNNYLDANGLFIFDMNSEYKYKHILSDNTIAENREECSFIWENYYDENKMINEYNVTIYVKLEEDEEKCQESHQIESNQLFERFQETHYQKAYSIETIKKLLEKAGMEFIVAYDAFTHNSPTDKSERIYFIAKEKHHDKKKYI